MKARKHNREKLLFELMSVFLIVLCWEGLAAHFAKSYENGSYLFPSLYSVLTRSFLNLSAFYGMGGLGTGNYGVAPSAFVSLSVIAYHTARTFLRIAAGFLIGVSLGIFCGILYKANRYYHAFTSIPSRIVSIVPQMALITLFLAWFGDSEAGYILFIAFGIFVAVYINTVNAIENLPPVYHKFSSTLGAGKARFYWSVALPGIIPELSGCMKMIVGQAWALSMASEFISSQNGLGRIIVLARQRLDTGIILIVLFLYVIYTLLTLKVLYRLCAYLTRWQPQMESSAQTTNGKKG
ncbi:ABC transporter permease [Provencibacterium massiliense]|uniref:ABC transporter permease n=1 Tax=Provencibacterium massiliense TaxID=1841868 RepID=UPI0009A59E2E|nr:ABC transporter permease subunit [Provencibacterium massiliense]RGB64928.1 ABC transporter permease subunit [Harryflintia acetispora]